MFTYFAEVSKFASYGFVVLLWVAEHFQKSGAQVHAKKTTENFCGLNRQ